MSLRSQAETLLLLSQIMSAAINRTSVGCFSQPVFRPWLVSSSRELSPQLGQVPWGITDCMGCTDLHQLRAWPQTWGLCVGTGVWKHHSWSVFRPDPALIGGGCFTGWNKLCFLWVFD